MNKRLKEWYDTACQGIGDVILLIVIMYAGVIYWFETTYNNYRHRRNLAKIHRENPDITELTKLSGIKQPD